MNARKSRMHTAATVVVTLAVVLSAAPASAATDDSPITAESFHSHLADQATSSPEAAAELRKFEALSSSDQQKLVRYLVDPDVATAFEYTARTSHSMSIENGDVEMTADFDRLSSPISADDALSPRSARAGAGTTYNVTSRYDVEQRVLGVLITKLSQTFRYVTGRGAVLRTSNCTAAAVNFNFAVQLESSVSHYMLAGGRAECDIVWHGYIAYKGLGVQIDKTQSMVVNGPGIVSRTLRNA